MTINYHEALEELSTIGDLIRWTASRFYEQNLHFGHGTDNAWDEAVALVLQALSLTVNFDAKLLSARLTRQERQKILGWVKQRITQHIPLAYLTHKSWFANLEFYVDERVLIPRSPIAELINNQFTPWVSPQSVHRILDLCTGSGCIAVAAAINFPSAQVTATDISQDALAVAQINCEHYDLTQQIQLIHSNLFKKLPVEAYDIIVSNPPYVSAEEINSLPAEYRHEPELALLAEEKGLAIVLQILKTASKYLSPHGILVVEVGNSQQALVELLPEVPFVWLEFDQGGEGVFLLTAEELHNCQSIVDKFSGWTS